MSEKRIDPESMYPGGSGDVTIHEGQEMGAKRSAYYKKTGRHLDLYGREPILPAGCFVATAVYGSYDCPEVMKLRTFRDDCLRKYALGRAFIAVYYRYGPKLAEAVKGRRLLSAPIKSILDIFIRIFLDRKPGS